MQNVRRRVHTARLYPVPAQASQLEEQGHTARALWNLLHEVVHVPQRRHRTAAHDR